MIQPSKLVPNLLISSPVNQKLEPVFFSSHDLSVPVPHHPPPLPDGLPEVLQLHLFSQLPQVVAQGVAGEGVVAVTKGFGFYSTSTNKGLNGLLLLGKRRPRDMQALMHW